VQVGVLNTGIVGPVRLDVRWRSTSSRPTPGPTPSGAATYIDRPCLRPRDSTGANKAFFSTRFSRFGAVESGAARVIEIYQRHALAWSRDRAGRFLERAWCDRFLALLDDQHRTVLDIGCGTGRPIAEHLIENQCQLCGVDSSSTMIEMCVERFPDHQWHVADMRALDLGRTFGGIVAWSSFFHLTPEDQRAMFPVFRRHAAAGAALIFTTGPSAGQGFGRLQGEPLYTASLDSTEYRALLNDHGFDVIAHTAEDPRCGKQTVWLAQLCQ